MWVSGAKGEDPTRLVRYTDHLADPPDWSPDSTKIAYYGGSIVVIDPSTGERSQITSGGYYDTSPDWSPDGSAIAFTRSGNGIYIVDLTTGVERQLTSHNDQDPDWSPDGSDIVFDRYGRRGGLFVVNVATGEERRLVGDGVYKPQWSPTGEWIAYDAGDIYIVRPDGTDLSNLSQNFYDAWHDELTWSPDGTRIAFTDDKPGLLIADITSGKRTRLKIGKRGSVTDPVWTPGGRRIVFSLGLAILYSIRPDGTGLRRIAEGRAPSMSPDGTRIAFMRSSN